MPLFSRNSTVETAPPPAVEPHRSSTLFSRHRSDEPGMNTTNSVSPKRHGILHRNDEDPSIIQARKRVVSAEAAEKEADRALVVARRAVKEAREEIRRLEKEAEREAKLARIKQEKTAGLTKRGHGLGRHDHI